MTETIERKAASQSGARPARYRRSKAELEALNNAIIAAVEADQPVTARGVYYRVASETFAHEVARSLGSKRTHIAQLGDHDPSGLDAWRDFTERVAAFAPSADVTFERIAVTPEQIVQYQLPTRPTKKTDSRASKFDGDSVEVDALPATVLRQVVEDTIVQRIEQDAWDATRQAEQAERERLARFADGGI